MTFPNLPLPAHPAWDFFGESHIRDIFSPKHITKVPTMHNARLRANFTLTGSSKAVAALIMVVLREDGHYVLVRFLRGGDWAQEIWDFGKGD